MKKLDDICRALGLTPEEVRDYAVDEAKRLVLARLGLGRREARLVEGALRRMREREEEGEALPAQTIKVKIERIWRDG